MKTDRMICLLFIAAMIWSAPIISMADDTAAAKSDENLSLDEILDRVETRYAGTGFTAEFKQESTVKAMEITDSASGRVYVKRPNKMRWEYTEPEPQIIISDGTQLWVYRPEDNQVMVGKAPTFFGGGKGAGFLTNINAIRKDFDVTRLKEKEEWDIVLKLVPKQKTPDLLQALLYISRETYIVKRVITYNTYGDETRIDLLNLELNIEASPELFKFKAPEGVEVLELES